MTINLRDLYPRLTGLRSDIDAGKVGWALEEALYKLASDSNLLRTVLAATTLPLGAVSLLLTLPADKAMGRVEKVEYYDPDDEDQEWTQLDESAAVYVEAARIAPESKTVNAVPRTWALRSNTLFFTDPSDKAYPLRITYAWVPVRGKTDMGVDFDLPTEAADALVAYGEYLVWRQKGEERDMKLSELALSNYKHDYLPSCKAIADSGPSGCRSIFDFLLPE
jgi:hypothetical protein